MARIVIIVDQIFRFSDVRFMSSLQGSWRKALILWCSLRSVWEKYRKESLLQASLACRSPVPWLIIEKGDG